MSNTEKKYVTPYISNKRYSNIKRRIGEFINGTASNMADISGSSPSSLGGVPCDEFLDQILEIMCDETNYDPNIKQYNEQRSISIKRYQKKKLMKREQRRRTKNSI